MAHRTVAYANTEGLQVCPPELPSTQSRLPRISHRMRRAVSQSTSDSVPPLPEPSDTSGPSSQEGSTSSKPSRKSSILSGVMSLLGSNTADPIHQCADPHEKDDAPSDTEIEKPTTGSCIPVTPTEIMNAKYRRSYVIPENYADPTDIPTLQSLQIQFAPLSTLHYEDKLHWKPYESPEGGLYFREKDKRILTFVDLFNEHYLSAVSERALKIHDILSNQRDSAPSDTEIVIMLEEYDTEEGQGLYGSGYYLASWEKRRIFWLADVSYEYVTRDIRICLTESHLEKQIELLFWVHAGIFPCERSFSPEVVTQAIKLLNFGIYDHISSDQSAFPYDKTDAADMIKCLERIEGTVDDAHDIWVVARCKFYLAEYKFLNYHGQRGARISRFDSVRRKTIRLPRSIFFQIITPFLFFMPSVYMKEIEGVWIDGTVDWIAWRKFITLLDKDWSQSMTPATVILSANVGFLAIGSIDHDGAETRTRSAAQIASYISSVLSFFFFITVQVLTHHHRTSQYFTAERAYKFLERRSQQRFGLQSVALTYSLPTGLFIWSMLFFLAALMIVFFRVSDLVTQVILGVTVVTLLIVTATLLYLDWDNHAWMHGHFDTEATTQAWVVYLTRILGLRSAVFSARKKGPLQGFIRLIHRNKSTTSFASELSTGTLESDGHTIIAEDEGNH